MMISMPMWVFSMVSLGWAIDLTQETVAGVDFQSSLKTLTKRLGRPVFSREIYDESARCWVSIAHFEEKRSHKIEVELCRSSRKLKIRSIRAVGDSQAQTSKFVGMGSKLGDLIKVYSSIKMIANDCVIVEDLRHAITLRFIIEQGIVSEINFYLDPSLKQNMIQADFTDIF